MKKVLFLIFIIFIFMNNINAVELELSKNSKSAILIEPTTKEIIYSKNKDERLAPASMTKMMTLLLTMEAIEDGKISMNDEVLISKKAASMGGTQIFIKEGTSVKISDLIKGIGIASANDAAVAIAEKVGGTLDNFVLMMNKKVEELELKNTNFKNPHGLDEKDHYSSAYDMSIIASELVKHESILKITSTYEEYINVSGNNHWLVNTNTLVRFYKGMDGLKTGYTDNAGYCLTGTMKRNNMRLIGVVMNSASKENRNEDMINMMEYGFSNYNIKNIINKNESLGKVYINNTNKQNIDYYVNNDVNILVDLNTKEINYDIRKEFSEAKAPLKKKDVIGKLYLNYNNKEYEYDLIVNKDIKKSNYIMTLINNLKDILSGKINILI